MQRSEERLTKECLVKGTGEGNVDGVLQIRLEEDEGDSKKTELAGDKWFVALASPRTRHKLCCLLSSLGETLGNIKYCVF